MLTEVMRHYMYRRAIMYGPTRNQPPFLTHIS